MKERYKMSDDVRIVQVKPVSAPTKITGNRYTNPYVKYEMPVIYVLIDGREVAAHATFNLLRDAKAEFASLPKAPDKIVYAMFRDGDYYGTTSSFWIGPRDDQPCTAVSLSTDEGNWTGRHLACTQKGYHYNHSDGSVSWGITDEGRADDERDHVETEPGGVGANYNRG